MTVLRSRDNPRLRRWLGLVRDPRRRRRVRRALIEGPHLLGAALDRGMRPVDVLLSEDATDKGELAALVRRAGRAPVVLSPSLFRAIADVEAPAGIAAEIRVPETRSNLGSIQCCVFLDGIQDAGNVGAILRSAAAFGVGATVLGPGCADPWSPKVLRAAMGAHFSLRIEECRDLCAALARFGGKAMCTVPRGGVPLAEADLSGRVGWIFGAEGQGVSAALAARAAVRVTVPMPGGSESLNVAATAAICLYEFSKRAARS